MDSQEGRWVEFVQDLWDEERLKHLWDVAMPYVNEHQLEFDPATQMYGFQSLQIEDEIEADEPLLFVLTEEVEEADREQPVLPEVPSVTEPQETTQPPAVAPKSKWSSYRQTLYCEAQASIAACCAKYYLLLLCMAKDCWY